MLEMLLWPVGRDSEQGVMLHVCCKALQRRPFRMTWLEVGARRALGAVGGARRDSATMCYSGPGAGRSGGVLPGPVALRALEVASYRRSRGRGQGAPRTCRCIEMITSWGYNPPVREHHAPAGHCESRCRCSECRRVIFHTPNSEDENYSDRGNRPVSVTDRFGREALAM